MALQSLPSLWSHSRPTVDGSLFSRHFGCLYVKVCAWSQAEGRGELCYCHNEEWVEAREGIPKRKQNHREKLPTAGDPNSQGTGMSHVHFQLVCVAGMCVSPSNLQQSLHCTQMCCVSKLGEVGEKR
jgi:hypothetical protein